MLREIWETACDIVVCGDVRMHLRALAMVLLGIVRADR